MHRPGFQVRIAHTLKELVDTPEVIGTPAAWTGLPLVVNEAVDIIQGLLIAIIRRPDLRRRRVAAGDGDTLRKCV